MYMFHIQGAISEGTAEKMILPHVQGTLGDGCRVLIVQRFINDAFTNKRTPPSPRAAIPIIIQLICKVQCHSSTSRPPTFPSPEMPSPGYLGS